MSRTEGLRRKLAALRAPLADATDPTTGPEALSPENADVPIRQLQQLIEIGQVHSNAAAALVRAAATGQGPEQPPLPAQLSTRARRLLAEAQAIVGNLRAAADRVIALGPSAATLLRVYRETVALAEVALRSLQNLPGAAALQTSPCEGLEALLHHIGIRAAQFQAQLSATERETERVHTLAGRLRNLAEGKPERWQEFVKLGEVLAGEAAAAAPVHWYVAGPLVHERYRGEALEPVRQIACHALNTAQIVARLLRHEPECRERLSENIAAALVLDAGMLRVPREAWLHPAALAAGQRRKVESHARASMEIAQKLAPEAHWLHPAVAAHHERLDGTGYPAGQRGQAIPALARWLAVADVYAALLEPRVHRPAVDSRAALSEVLLLAEKKLLDPSCAERLLQFSFYPVGTAVELADGSTGVVVANHMSRRDRQTPTRPVVELVKDAQGKAPAGPRHLDLNDCEGQSIVRVLTRLEQRELMNFRRSLIA